MSGERGISVRQRQEPGQSGAKDAVFSGRYDRKLSRKSFVRTSTVERRKRL